MEKPTVGPLTRSILMIHLFRCTCKMMWTCGAYHTGVLVRKVDVPPGQTKFNGIRPNSESAKYIQARGGNWKYSMGYCGDRDSLSSNLCSLCFRTAAFQLVFSWQRLLPALNPQWETPRGTARTGRKMQVHPGRIWLLLVLAVLSITPPSPPWQAWRFPHVRCKRALIRSIKGCLYGYHCNCKAC